MSQARTVLALAGVLFALGACDRRPGDPPRPTTSFDATPVTAGLAGLSGPPTAKPPHGPASDPPPNPVPRAPSAPGSSASGVTR